MVHARYECVARPEPTRSKSSRAETLLMEVVSRPRSSRRTARSGLASSPSTTSLVLRWTAPDTRSLNRVDEDRQLSGQSGCYSGDLVGAAKQAHLQFGLEHQRGRTVAAAPGLVIEALRRADSMRGLQGDLTRALKCHAARIFRNACDQPECGTLADGNEAACKRQLFRNVDGYQPGQRLSDAHVWHDAPLDLHDG